jgi:hypothetical protein
MKNHNIIEIAGELGHETEKAYQFFDGKVTVWLPKSQAEWDAHSKTMQMAEWLAMERGLIGPGTLSYSPWLLASPAPHAKSMGAWMPQPPTNPVSGIFNANRERQCERPCRHLALTGFTSPTT